MISLELSDFLKLLREANSVYYIVTSFNKKKVYSLVMEDCDKESHLQRTRVTLFEKVGNRYLVRDHYVYTGLISLDYIYSESFEQVVNIDDLWKSLYYYGTFKDSLKSSSVVSSLISHNTLQMKVGDCGVFVKGIMKTLPDCIRNGLVMGTVSSLVLADSVVVSGQSGLRKCDWLQGEFSKMFSAPGLSVNMNGAEIIEFPLDLKSFR